MRQRVEERVQAASAESRALFRSGVQQVIGVLIQKYEGGDTGLAKKGRTADHPASQAREAEDQASSQRREKASLENQESPLYEQLGFRGELPFQARSEVRQCAQRFLRFSFLFDFIALHSLSQVYLQSIQEGIAKLSEQLDQRVDYQLREQTEAERLAQAAFIKTPDGAAVFAPGAYVPIFKADVLFRELSTQLMPRENIYEEEVDSFELPPLGRSKREDFNPMVHLELVEEAAEEPEDEEKKRGSDEESSGNSSGDAESEDDELASRKPKHRLPPTEEEL